MPRTDPGALGSDEKLCQLLHCLLRPEALGRWLVQQKLDPAVLEKCIERWCEAGVAVPSDAELRRREGT